jgi:hypothetical protein
LQKPALPKKKALKVSGGVSKPVSGAAEPKTATKPKVGRKDSVKKGKQGKKTDGTKAQHAKSAYQCFCAAKRGATHAAVHHASC